MGRHFKAKENVRERRIRALSKICLDPNIINAVLEFDPDKIRYSNSRWTLTRLISGVIDITDLTPRNSFLLDIYRGLARRECKTYPRREWYLYSHCSFECIQKTLARVIISGFQGVGFQPSEDMILVYGYGEIWKPFGHVRKTGIESLEYGQYSLETEKGWHSMESRILCGQATREIAFLSGCDIKDGFHFLMEQNLRGDLKKKTREKFCLSVLACLMSSDTDGGMQRLSSLVDQKKTGMSAFSHIWKAKQLCQSLQIDGFIRNLFIIMTWAKFLSMGHRIITLTPN